MDTQLKQKDREKYTLFDWGMWILIFLILGISAFGTGMGAHYVYTLIFQ